MIGSCEWYVINTKSHHESQAEQNLIRLGVETFNPQIRETKLIRRVRRTVIAALFPSYVFARFDVVTQYRAVSYAKGVRKVVAFGSVPAKVDDDLIQAVRSRLSNGYVTKVSLLKPGQAVRLQTGPFCGLEAIFEREMTGQQRAVLLLHMLAYQARVIVPLDQVANL